MRSLKLIRNGLAACVALLAIISTAVKATAQTPAISGVKTVLLVHGAWADGSSWAKVIPLLEAKGLHADPPDIVCGRRCGNAAGH